MNKPLLVGITGGIGSGKSTVSAIFELLQVPVYNADLRARLLMTEDQALAKAITQNFGEEAYREGQLNRQYLAEKVFASRTATDRLNALVHPAVARDFDHWSTSQQAPYVLKEAALLFETGSYKALNQVVLVTAPKELRILRVQKRDPQRSREQIENIIDKQMSETEARNLANEVLINDGRSLLIPQVIAIHEKIKRAIR